MVFSNIHRSPGFEDDLRRLSGKYVTLEEDLQIVIGTVLKLYHRFGINDQAVTDISPEKAGNLRIYRVTKFACRSLKGKKADSGFRLVYTYDHNQDRVTLIQIYHTSETPDYDHAKLVDG